MEIIRLVDEDSTPLAFKIDLIVWKFQDNKPIFCDDIEFKIDLIVWKFALSISSADIWSSLK